MNDAEKGNRILKLYGLSESSITEVLKDLFNNRDDITWTASSLPREDHIVVSLGGNNKPVLDTAEQKVLDLIGTYVFASDNRSMEEVVGNMLSERSLTISVAESCTGGLIGNLLTNAPGSSFYFLGGIIAYSNKSKEDLLNVSSETLKKHGAVSSQTVREMAEGVKKQFNSHMGLAVTGIAGPDGGSEEKPVGTVFLGLAVENEIFSAKYRFHGDRGQVKEKSATMALDWIRRCLKGDPLIPGI
ncbi:nicotinamide-nucleotide amidohydrolase family protein [Thermodesulfobacteriota bacterium]